MVETEWTFKIPETLKKAVKEGEANFFVNYHNEEGEIVKTLSITKRNEEPVNFCTQGISQKELEDCISRYLYTIPKLEVRIK